MSSAFLSIDLAVLVLYIGASLGLGLYHARGQRSLEDYFLAERSAPWWAAGISAIASDTSAISYMGVPAYVFRKDLQLALGFVLTFPLMMLVVARLFVPFLARLRLYTVYEYLERRFGAVGDQFGGDGEGQVVQPAFAGVIGHAADVGNTSVDTGDEHDLAPRHRTRPCAGRWAGSCGNRC